jgi:quinol monooxygenase YgiN
VETVATKGRKFDTFNVAAYYAGMKSRFVSLHPYFKIHPGKMDEIKKSLPEFIERTATEKGNLFYEFSMNGDELFCREAYENADALLAHVNNVGALLADMFEIADLTRIEVHGPAEELAKLKKPLTHLNPAFFELQ